ncbi:phosphatase PAP2 family protein [Elstera sp.]|jgi:lipid A 4'-phosphatase|uniref:phosphatase PAP2 family protein n=1 Tax=Elstera sp. TaxID=1916664 RepID=UPI0037BE6295
MRALLVFCTAALLGAMFIAVPEIDRGVAALGYRPGAGFALGQAFPFQALHNAVPYLMALIPLGAVGLWLARRLSGLEAAFLLLAVGLGPGLLANTILKDNWGRARPSHTIEFGGTKHFSPPLIPADQCAKNCAFVSGDAAGGFAFLAPALLVPLAWRRRAVLAALATGALFGANRILQGGHFFSDVIFAGFFVGGLIWALHWAMLDPGGARLRAVLAAQTSTPVRRYRLYAAVILPLIPISILAFDRDIARWSRGLPEGLRAVFEEITRLGLGVWWLVGSALIVAWCGFAAWRAADAETQARWMARMRPPLFFFSACAVSGITNSGLKAIIGRTRPRLFFDRALYTFDPPALKAVYLSLPSGHTAMVFAVATSLALLLPRHWAPALYSFATVIAFSRVITNAHWLADILAGSLVGIGMTLLCHQFFVKRAWLMPK